MHSSLHTKRHQLWGPSRIVASPTAWFLHHSLLEYLLYFGKRANGIQCFSLTNFPIVCDHLGYCHFIFSAMQSQVGLMLASTVPTNHVAWPDSQLWPPAWHLEEEELFWYIKASIWALFIKSVYFQFVMRELYSVSWKIEVFWEVASEMVISLSFLVPWMEMTSFPTLALFSFDLLPS